MKDKGWQYDVVLFCFIAILVIIAILVLQSCEKIEPGLF